jgi:glycosyltransferase Alg8
MTETSQVNHGSGAASRRSGTLGFAVYTLGLMTLALLLFHSTLTPISAQFAAVIGILAVWRYSWGLIHFCRSLIYRKIVFPDLRAQAEAGGKDLMPPHVYLLLTSFRISSETSMRVYGAAIREAIACGIPATIVASIVEASDELLIKELFVSAQPPEDVKLQFVRIPGTGKRDGLGQGFRAKSRSMPEAGSLIAVIDGDSELQDGLIRKCAPFFSMMPNLGALTTDEDCDVEGSEVMTQWHRLRFAQRNILMSSVALSCKVMTLTGRMSMFRAEIATDPKFIAHVETDSIEHWRLGYFKFLTGDDKSTWYWVLKGGYDMLYVPDVSVHTIETPPSRSFLKATTMLMLRWSGNMLRINGQAFRLGPGRVGLFPWACILDQRISMWTSLTGPTFALYLGIKHSWAFILLYIVWIGFTRWIMTLMLLSSRPYVSWYYPFLMYYNQIWGSCIKTYALFRLDRQSWTRQKTSINRSLTGAQQFMMNSSSLVMHSVAILFFIAMVGLLAGVLTVPSLHS